MSVLHRAAWLLTAALVMAPHLAFAQTARGAQSEADASLAQEALAFREKIRGAVTAKDKAALDAAYASNFTHLRDSGRVDHKGDRIALLLSGESTIETAPEENMTVQVFTPATVAVVGVSPVKDRQTGRSPRFRWLAVYVKQADGWRVAVSQASRAQGQR
jgi:Domain of unknown function (DUF4440)